MHKLGKEVWLGKEVEMREVGVGEGNRLCNV